MNEIVVITNYVGLLKHIKRDTDFHLKAHSPLRAMVKNYQKKVLRLYIGDHVLCIDLASKPQQYLTMSRTLECIRAKARGQLAQHAPFALLVRSTDAAEMRASLHELIEDSRIAETQHCSCCYGRDMETTHFKLTAFVNFDGVQHIECLHCHALGVPSRRLLAE